MNPTLTFAHCADRVRRFIGGCQNAVGDAAEAEFNSIALDLFGTQYCHNHAYRRLCEARKILPLDVTEWREIPAVPTLAFKEMEMTGLRPEERTAVFHSSGTTQQRPSRHFHSAQSLALYELSLLSAFESRYVRREEDPLPTFISLTPSPASVPHSSLVHMFQTIGTRSRVNDLNYVGSAEDDGRWTVDAAVWKKTFECAERENRPVLLLGTAFNFVQLIDLGKSFWKKLPPGSVVLETGGYKGRTRSIPRSELHGWVHEFFDVPVSRLLREYGMSELSSQAYDRFIDRNSRTVESSSIGFQFSPWVRVRIVSPETGMEVAVGETGLVRIMDLANVWSAIAIQTEDLAVRMEIGFELLERAQWAEPRGCSRLVE